MAVKSDPYQWHRIALAPLLPGATTSTLEESCWKARELGEREFAGFLVQQGLAALWYDRMDGCAGLLGLCADTGKILHDSRLEATGVYLLQRHCLENIKTIFDDGGIEHIVTKGSHTREVYFKTPSLRPAVDIDVLIRPEDKVRTIKSFQKKGFVFYGDLANIAQDCSLVKGKVYIDLHWDILRPGRTRVPMVDSLIAERVNYESHWGADHAATLFMMLVHPVFRKYTTTPHATLVRLIDLILLLDQHPECLPRATSLLSVAGLKTAGWITATWLHILSGNQQAAEFAQSLAPGRLRQHYLRNWLERNRSSALLAKPLQVQLGFTLPAHDRVSDAVRAVWIAEQCRRGRQRTLAELERELA